MQLGREELSKAYFKMRMIRTFEERMHVEFATGEVPGFVHLYAGQEASAVGICAHLGEQDYFHITHRAHGPAIAKGADVTTVAKEIYCRGEGLCKGRGGSAHLHDKHIGLIGANSGVGSGAALACGSAIATRHKGNKGVAVALLGDGAAGQGVVSEAMNLASIWGLPVIFAFENNGYAESTSADYAIAGKSLANRAVAFGMPGIEVDGHDFFAVHKAVEEAVTRARAGDGPSVIEIRQLRYMGHFEGDAQKYRSKEEIDNCKRDNDCLSRFRDTVTTEGMFDMFELDGMDQEIEVIVDEAYAEARAAPLPEIGTMFEDVYGRY